MLMKPATREFILNIISQKDKLYVSSQSRLCIPIINRIYRKMLVGIRFTEIKVDNGLICDGHHRYIASLLANYDLGIVSGTRTSATKVVDWINVDFVMEDWDTSAKITHLNELDAAYSGITLRELVELLK